MPRPVSDAFMGHLSNVPTALDHSGLSDVVTVPVVKRFIGYLGNQIICTIGIWLIILSKL